MKKTIYLSIVCIGVLQATEQLEDINIVDRVDIQQVSDVSGEEIKSSDLAEALEKNSPSITIIRRSGVANDIILRGQKRDNINITVDGMKVCGACPNRMDPPTSHVMTQNIDSVEITEGPFDVEEFGTLSGKVKVKTLKPNKDISGEINLNGGSWGYKKEMARVSGGTDSVKFLISGSTEEGGQYRDGNGDNFAKQLSNQVDGTPQAGMAYLPNQKDRDAYKRKSVMSKIFWDITPDQELKFSYTANRSDGILYPNTPMDADYDDSNLYNLQYSIKNLSNISKKLDLQIYQTDVVHPMSTQYRKASKVNGVIKHQLATKMQGVKLNNSLDISSHKLKVGLDFSKRNWDGKYYKNNNPLPIANFHSIYDVDTKNQAIFIKDEFKLSHANISMGIRYDDTTITNEGQLRDNDYSSLTGNIMSLFKPSSDFKYFIALGKSSRVPDGRELYFHKNGVVIGTPNLKETQNYEADIGFEKALSNNTLKSKLYYSKLKDYIYYNASTPDKQNYFSNIDAHIYGVEVSGSYLATNNLNFDYGLAYSVGRKDTLAKGQHDKNLADISPLKFTLSSNYEFETATLKLEMVARDKWDMIDSENGEQTIAGYTVFNLKWDKEINDNLTISLGMDNILNRTYAISNTQKDLTLVGGDKTMLLNEPARYTYINAKYQF